MKTEPMIRMTMNHTAGLPDLERLFFRSCLESTPTDVAPQRFLRFAATRSGDRAHSQLHQLKRRLLRATLEETPQAGLFKRLCGAANQAAVLAWTTASPLLVFPRLFEELAQQARDQFQREPRGFADAPDCLPAVAVDPGSEAAHPVYGWPHLISIAGAARILSIPAGTC